jgi:hypothetical protein
LRLESFRIRNCFGFWDSGEIDLGAPGNLVYFLGRNSSGKTSVLRAISYFEYGVVPEQQPNFQNYESIAGKRTLRARFSVDPSAGHKLSVAPLFDEVIQRFANAGLQAGVNEDGFSVSPSSQGAKEAAALLDHINECYSDLVKETQDKGEVWIEKVPNGSYKFLTEEDGYESYDQRRETIVARIDESNRQLRNEGKTPLSLDFDWIEGLPYKQFPEIFFFTERFSLEEDLPRSIRTEHLKGEQNALIEAFLSIIDRQTWMNLLAASGRARLKRYNDAVQEALDALSAEINQDTVEGVADADFIRFYVDRTRDVRIVLEVDGKESYYEHLSDNTKFLIAYHIFQQDRARKNALNSILLFDEPSKGFHSTAERKILRFLQSLAERGNQVLISTHSQHLIDLDRLTAVRIMSRDENGHLCVDNRLYGSSGAGTDTLALQPVTDAIGLRYADQLVTRDKVVITEGYTELLYLRLFSRLLGYDELNLAPVTGEGKILTFISFLASQGISFKVALDSSKVKSAIQRTVPVPNDSFFVIAAHLGLKAKDPVGIVTINDGLSYGEHIFLNDRRGGFKDATARLWPDSENLGLDDNMNVFLDFDSDGDADLLIGSLDGPDRLLMNDGSGKLKLVNRTQSILGDTPGTLAIAVADLNGDRKLDVVEAQGEGAWPEKVYLGKNVPADTSPPMITQVEKVSASGADRRLQIRARVHDNKSPTKPHDWQSVVLRWRMDGQTHQTPMQWYGEYLWRGTIDEPPTGDFSYKVCATDAAGNNACASP